MTACLAYYFSLALAAISVGPLRVAALTEGHDQAVRLAHMPTTRPSSSA